MRTERIPFLRLSALALAATALPLMAQNAAAAPAPSLADDVSMPMIYGLLATAVVQVIFILSLSSIMRTLGGTSVWAKRLSEGGKRALVLLPLMGLASLSAHAQAYKGDGGTIPQYHLFWWLVGTNVFLFVVLLAQINVLRGMTRAVTSAVEPPDAEEVPSGPTWEQRILASLTRQKPIEQEQDILMHHEYDGIRELDNVLPPWWLWLFYGSIAWGVVYLANVHMFELWPKQAQEYTTEMAQARTDVDAYLAAQKNAVDERTAERLTDAGTLAAGAGIFKQNCATCHGQLGEGVAGPNLTDAYWLHGGGIKDLFTTIKYGVNGKAMKAWQTDLKPLEIQSVANFILSLQGTNPPNPKAPEGEIWKDAAPSAVDTMAAPADTVKLAAN